MKKIPTLLFSAILAVSVFSGNPARADNMASLSIAPATGAVTLVPRWSIGSNLAGFHYMAQDLGLTGAVASSFYSISNLPIPMGGDILAFNFYVAASGAATPHADIGSKLTPDSYSALTSADPDLGYGAVNFYFIHHKGTTDYFSTIVPGPGTSSAVTDLKPMSAPGGPSTVTGVSGYFGLTFAASNLGQGANNFYYLRNDPVTSTTKFGVLAPALLSTSADLFDLGGGGHNALAFTGTDVGYGTEKMYYLRLDPITGFTILGTLDPAVAGIRHTADIANLGSVYSTLTFVPGDVSFGVNQFYTTGSVNPTWQSVSFAAIADRTIAAGPFNVTPSASSALPITLTVVPGSIGAASIVNAGGGMFTVTPTAPGLITLQATQAGQAAPSTPVYEYNMLRQSFTITGLATLQIITQPTNQTVVTGATANFSVTAAGTSALSYQWRKAGINVAGNASAATANFSIPNAQAADMGTYDVAVTNASGTIYSDPVTLTVTTAAPIITNSPLTAGGTVGSPFSFTITASGSPTSYTASPLPPGLTIDPSNGTIAGTPLAAGSTSVLLGATNGSGTGNATLTITVAAAGVAPIIASSPVAAGTVGTTFTYAITASGSPTSFSASPLPAGLAINTTTGVITGTPTTTGATSVTLGATNGSGTGNATLTITIAALGVAPVIASSPVAAGTVGTPFSYTITAAGSPTSFSASPLPAGLTINTTTGVITGTPTTAGVTAVTLGATNGSGTGNATLTITVAALGVAPVIASSPAAAGTVGTPFSYTITAAGSPTSYTASPLPAGLAINATTGVISGTPTTAGVTAVTLGATNGSGTGNATLTITVAALGVAPVIASSPTAAGTVGTPFSYTITAAGSPTSYTASPLPAGLAVNPTTGVISGTPTTAGATTVTLGATNGSGTGNATLTITVAAAVPATAVPVITSGQTASAVVGTPFSYTVTASGSPTSYSASPLPAGLSINSATGVISGTPTTVFTTSVQLGATNSLGTGYATLTISTTAELAAPIIITQPSPQSVAAGQSTTFTVTAGVDRDPAATYQWQRRPAGSTVWENLREGGSYNGVTTSTLTVKAPTPASSGDQFRSIITNGTGSTTSSAVSITVGAGTDAMFQYPASVGLDSSGNLFVADSFGNTIRKITPAGVVSTLAGAVGQAGSQDGSGAAARFNQPGGVTVDSSGNVYVSDTGNATIRRITPGGVVSTLAGTANTRGSADGTGSAASFGSPSGLALDASGNLFVADSFNATIRKITPAGVVTTLAGLATNRGSADGTGSAARFNYPNGVTVDSAGNVYVADTYNATIRRITPAGVVTTLAGLPGVSGADNGTGMTALFNQPYGVSVDAAGNVYVADTGNSTIRRVTPAGVVTTLAGVPGIAGLENGTGSNALFNQPHGLVVIAGKVYVADTGNATIRVVSSNNEVTTLAMNAEPAVPPTTPAPGTPPSTGTPPSSGGSGGGAPSLWFVGLLALLSAGRKWLKPARGFKPRHRGAVLLVAVVALLAAPIPGSAQAATGSVLLSPSGVYVPGASPVTLIPGTPSFLNTIVIDGVIANGSAPASLTATAVAVTLTGANTYTGGTYIDAGSLVASASTLPANQLVVLANNTNLTFNQSADATFGGAVSGSGSLTKVGSGVLTVSGANTYTGGTSVDAGTLVASTSSLPASQNVNVSSGAILAFNQTSDGTYAGNLTGSGTVQKRGAAQLSLTRATSIAMDLQAGWLFMNGGTGTTTIGANASLGGTGTVTGNLTNNGRLSPGYSPGTINVTGNYVQASTGTLVIQLASGTSFDQLVVTGSATLAGSVQIDILGGADIRGQSFTFLTAAGGVTGRFSSESGTAYATSLPTAAATVLYGPNTVTFTIVQVPFADFAETPNQIAVANAAQSAPALTTALNTLPDASQFPAALNALSPQGYQVWSGFAFASATALSDRLARAGRMTTGRDDYYFEAGQRRSRSQADFDTGSVTSTSDSALVGGNRALNAGTDVGAFFGFGKTTSGLGSAGSSTTVKDKTVGVRAAWTHRSMFAEAMLAYGFNRYSSTRSIGFPGTAAVATSSTRGHQWTTGITAGHHIDYGRVTLSPFGGLLASRWEANRFAEEGAGAFNATLADQSARSLRSQLGAEGRLNLGKVQPHVRAAWLHEFSQDSRSLNASFGNVAYALTTRRAPRDVVVYSAGLDFVLGERALLYTDFSAQNGGDTRVLNEWRAGLAVGF